MALLYSWWAPARAATDDGRRNTLWTILIAGGRIIDPGNGMDTVADVLINDGVVREVPYRIPAESMASMGVIDRTGMVVSPGFIDIHAHLGNLATSTRRPS